MSVSGKMFANYQVIFEYDPLVHSQKKGTCHPTLPCRMASTASLIDEKPAEGEFASHCRLLEIFSSATGVISASNAWILPLWATLVAPISTSSTAAPLLIAPLPAAHLTDIVGDAAADFDLHGPRFCSAGATTTKPARCADEP